MSGLTDAEEAAWLVDRERGGWQYATERIIAARVSDAVAAFRTEAVGAIEAVRGGYVAASGEPGLLDDDERSGYLRGLESAARLLRNRNLHT